MSDRLQRFIERMKTGEMLMGDGAWGTQMQLMGLQSGDCPEEWNIIHPDKIKKIARDYFLAGSDLCLTNTFGGTKYRLVRHGFADKVGDFNRTGASLCRSVADEFTGLVAGSVGPTGEFLQPEGMLSEREMYEAFLEQMLALKEGGVDAICIETMYVLDEALAAIKAAGELGLFCMACMTFDATSDGFKTMHGTSVEAATRALDSAGADVIGTNCGNGIVDMVRIARQMRALTKKPLMVKSNAGLPEIADGRMLYLETHQMMASKIQELKEIGVSIVGGCCGTTPEHIRAFREKINSWSPK